MCSETHAIQHFGHNDHQDRIIPLPKEQIHANPRKEAEKHCGTVAQHNHQNLPRSLHCWSLNAWICQEIPPKVTLPPAPSTRKQGVKGRKPHLPLGPIRTATVAAQSSCLGCSTQGRRGRWQCWSRAPMDAASMGLSPRFYSKRQP